MDDRDPADAMVERPYGTEAPFPDTYEGAVNEIRRLRRALAQANEMWANAKLKAELDARSRRGSAKCVPEQVK